MKKGKVLSTAMAVTLGLSSLGFSASASIPSGTESASVPEKAAYHGSGTFDASIANEERLIEMLKDMGKIHKDATPEVAQKALRDYLRKKEKFARTHSNGNSGKLDKERKEKERQGKKELHKKGLQNKNTPNNKKDLEPAQPVKWTGDVRKDKVLVILIDYPDLEHGSIQPEYTDMYYDKYPREHFQKMIFGENGYEGPHGNTLISMKQYYEEQSGGSYTVTGKVAGWYTAEHPAAYYGGNDPAPYGFDAHPRALIQEALVKAAQDVDLSNFDLQDPYDLDGDGNVREPDGIVDHLMVIHSGVGEEAGGGALGPAAIWSHSSNIAPQPIPGTEAEVDYWGGQMVGYNYTVEPEDGATGVFAHEFGHDLGLPDEYDTLYSGAGAPVAYWSIMASGSWAGKVPGTEPTGFSAYAKQFLQATMGGNWLTGTTVDLEDLDNQGVQLLLDQANTKGTNNDAVRINLPDKKIVVNTPYSGEYEYFSGSGNELDNSMVRTVDLTNASSAKLTFKTWYDIETGWDYGSIQVKPEGADQWTSIPGNITTTKDPHGQNPGYGITGTSNGWVDAVFDLSQYAGQKIRLRFNYWTDVAAVLPGFYVDDIAVSIDGDQVVFDNASGQPAFTLKGFTKDQGYYFATQYYLVEWRTHRGVDEGLAHIKRGNSLMSYAPGLVVWYVDNSYTNNWTGFHPGEGFLGVVDADQVAVKMTNGEKTAVAGDSRFQMHDAAFNFGETEEMLLDYTDFVVVDNHTDRVPIFNDNRDYSNPGLPSSGRDVPELGLRIKVTAVSDDQSVAQIRIYRTGSE